MPVLKNNSRRVLGVPLRGRIADIAPGATLDVTEDELTRLYERPVAGGWLRADVLSVLGAKPAPAPSAPAPSTPAPSTPAPSTPAPSTPAPSTPAPSRNRKSRAKAASVPAPTAPDDDDAFSLGE